MKKKISTPILKKLQKVVQEKEQKEIPDPTENLDEETTSEIIENGDYDSEDLALGDDLSLGDFEDPDFFDDLSEEYEEDEEDDKITMLYGLLGSFLEYDNQNIAELLCQIRDSVDSNSKCLLRVAHEMRSLHNTYIQNLLINTKFTEESLFNAGDHKESHGKTAEGVEKTSEKTSEKTAKKATGKEKVSTKVTPKKI